MGRVTIKPRLCHDKCTFCHDYGTTVCLAKIKTDQTTKTPIFI